MPYRSLALLLIATVAHAEPGPPPRVARFDRNGFLLPPGAVARLGVPPALTGLTADLAWTPDGAQFVAADWTTVTRFDAATGRPIETVRLDTLHRSLFATLSHDGQTLFRAAGPNCTLHDTATGTKLVGFENLPPTLNDPGRSVQSLSVSADHRFLAGTVGAQGGPTVAWRYDLARRRFARILPDWANLRSTRLAPDGRRTYAVAGTDKPLLIGHDLRTGRDLWAVLLDRPGTVRAASPDGRRLVLADGTHFRVFDTADGKELAALPYPANSFGGLRPVDLSPDGGLLAVADDATVTVWDVAAGKIRHKFPHPARLVAFSPDGKSLLSANAWVQRWDLATGKPMYPEPAAAGLNEPAPRLHWSGDGRRLLVIRPAMVGEAGRAARNADLTLWDAAAMTTVWRTTLPAEPVAVTLDRAGGVVRACTEANRLVTWTVGPPAVETAVALFDPTESWYPATRPGGFLRGGRLVLLRTTDRQASAHTFDPAGRPAGPSVPLPYAATRTRDGSIAPWWVPNGFVFQNGRRIDGVTGRPLPPLVHDGDRPAGFPFGTDSPLILTPVDGPSQRRTGTSLDRALLWESVSGRPLTGMATGLLASRFGAVSPDARWLAVAGRADLDLILIPSSLFLRRTEVYSLPAEKATAVAFSADARRLATAAADGTVTIWDVPTPAAEPWVETAASQLWADLGEGDPAAAWKAVWHLLDHPAEGTALLKRGLRPVPAVTDVPGLIARLDHSRYAVREAATNTLAGYGEAIEGDLTKALAGKPTAEQRERLEALVKLLDPTLPPTGDLVRGLRGVWLLERIGTPEARTVLAELATGAAGARVTAAAKEAMK